MWIKMTLAFLFLLKKYVFIQFVLREEGRGWDKEIETSREASLIGYLLHAPYWRWNP